MIKKFISRIFSRKSQNKDLPQTSSSTSHKVDRETEIERFRQSVNQRLNKIFDSSLESTQTQTTRARRHEKSPSTELRNKRPRRYSQNKKYSKGLKDPSNRNPSLPRGDRIKERETPGDISPLPQEGISVFNTETSFSEMGLSSQLNQSLTEHNFIHPSKAQEQAIPVILEKKNLICSSETGSGKTLAFVIPILERFLRKEIDQACILTPTREIAIQIESVMKPLADILGITTGLAIGGMDMLVQKKILREYPQVLIATPGRLVDVSSQGWVWLNYTSVVVMDEVDRMLDMGFEKEISTLFGLFQPQAQILMFTATMNAELEKLSQKYVKEYQLVTIGETMKTKASIEHLFISLSNSDRYSTLKSLLQKKRDQKVLVFFNSIDETIKIFRQLKRDRFAKLNCLHSRKSQDERNQVMAAFRLDKINHLLTTDVLARGIDIPNIDAVINYELPRDSEDYIHRIGRTGRADLLGKALSFVNKKDEIKLKRIKKLIKSDQGFNFIGINELKYF